MPHSRVRICTCRFKKLVALLSFPAIYLSTILFSVRRNLRIRIYFSDLALSFLACANDQNFDYLDFLTHNFLSKQWSPMTNRYWSVEQLVLGV